MLTCAGSGTPLIVLDITSKDWAWGVPFIPALPVVAVELLELGIVGIATEGLLDRFRVEDIGICRSHNKRRRKMRSSANDSLMRKLFYGTETAQAEYDCDEPVLDEKSRQASRQMSNPFPTLRRDVAPLVGSLRERLRQNSTGRPLILSAI